MAAEATLLASALACSGLALVLAAFCVLRGTPAAVAHALELALEAQARARTVEERYVGFVAECQTILGAVQDERDRTQKAAARASAHASKAAAPGASVNGPKSRDETLAELRQRIGMV